MKNTKETRKAILDGLEGGLTRESAAARAGISDRCLRKWCTESASFAVQVRIAEMKFVRLVESVASKYITQVVNRVAGNQSSVVDEKEFDRAIAWLQRRHGSQWRDSVKVESEVSGPGGGPIETSVNVYEMTVAEKKKYTEERLKRLSELAS